MTQPSAALLALPPPCTQTELRHRHFAKRLCETVSVAEAYRDVFDPGEDITPYHHISGSRLMKDEAVLTIVKEVSLPALVEMGVERNHALRRLLETIDSDITDYASIDGKIMSLAEMRNLPFEKRRLVKKIKERFDPETGELVNREIELEGKEGALRLLAQIKQWVQPGATVNVKNENIVNYITVANKVAEGRVKLAREAAAKSKSAEQLSRPMMVEAKLIETDK